MGKPKSELRYLVIFAALFFILISCTFSDNANLVSDCTLNGFGTDTKGGTFGIVMKVTNLNNNREGSLKQTLESKGKRLVIFEVGGYTKCKSSYRSIKVPDSLEAREEWLCNIARQIEIDSNLNYSVIENFINNNGI